MGRHQFSANNLHTSHFFFDDLFFFGKNIWWTHERIFEPTEPLHSKRTKKSSFLLVWPGAQTPRHEKMPILTDIIKHACNRFDIDPKDLCDDPESCAHSKSSSRAPDEGDENWLASLGYSKRCDNGQAYLVKTYDGRVETEEIMEYLLRLLHGYFHKKRPEQNISLRESRFGGTSTTTVVNSQVFWWLEAIHNRLLYLQKAI